LIPALQNAGFSSEDIDQLLISNPAKAYEIKILRAIADLQFSSSRRALVLSAKPIAMPIPAPILSPMARLSIAVPRAVPTPAPMAIPTWQCNARSLFFCDSYQFVFLVEFNSLFDHRSQLFFQRLSQLFDVKAAFAFQALSLIRLKSTRTF
jgi:hypothetical protein